MTPKILSFDEVTKPKGFFSKLFSSKKKKMPETEMSKREQDPFKDAIEPQRLLEYKPESIYMSEKPSASAPNFVEEANGIQIIKELKNKVNQLHAAHPHSKVTMAVFRSAIASRLRELGVGTSHTAAYVKQMRTFYDELFALSKITGITPE